MIGTTNLQPMFDLKPSPRPPAGLTCPPEAQPFYVALIGPLRDDAVGYLNNVHLFCRAAGELMVAGFCPLNPANDLLEVVTDCRLTTGMLQRRARQLIRLAALAPVGRRAALVLGVKNHQGKISWGSKAELQLCDELSLRFVQTLEQLRSMCESKP